MVMERREEPMELPLLLFSMAAGEVGRARKVGSEGNALNGRLWIWVENN